ncbi:hypothetical protein C2845_PM01G40950 [Panicum miliaceum]|uniref:Retrotransposon protein, putative, unclassified n=1 Tax=Panicum miliaceum TaxID=4540 RepID=A0A3L6TTT2_PANMI|nr:hypothetical protein C2845_PM01G40950 [Panicum miliaceum]
MPRKSTAGRGKKREGEGEGGSPPSAKVAKTVAEGEWRASTIRERDLLRLIAEQAFLGIRPHFNLFRHLFHLKQQPDENNPALVGGAGVQLRDKALYLEYTTPSTLSEWHAQWFYIENHQPSLHGWDNSPPQRQECWLKKLTKEERRDIPELMKRIKALKDKGVTGESVAYSFIERRIQLLQQRVHPCFEYQGLQDPSRMARDVPSVEEIMRRVTRLFKGVNLEPYIPRLFGADNSLDPRFRSDPPELIFEEPAQNPPTKRSAGDAVADPPRPQLVATRKWRTAAATNTATGRQATKLETPKPTTSNTAQVGTSEHSLPKELVVESTAEPPIVEDVPAVNEGKDLEPLASPKVEPEMEAPGTTPGPTVEEGTRTDQQGVASIPGQQDAPGTFSGTRRTRSPGGLPGTRASGGRGPSPES